MPYVERASDLVTEAEARAMVGLTHHGDNQVLILGLMVGALTEQIEDLCGPVVRVTVSNEIHTDRSGKRLLHLRRGPITSVTTVEEGTDTLTAETWGVDGGYLLEPHSTSTAAGSGALIRRYGQRDHCWGANVRVSYVAGRVVDTAAVPACFKEAMHIGLRNWWRMEQRTLGAVEDYETPQLAFPKFALPDSAKMALRSELLPKGMR